MSRVSLSFPNIRSRLIMSYLAGSIASRAVYIDILDFSGPVLVTTRTVALPA